MSPVDPFDFARDEFSSAVCEALRQHDFEAVESLREGPVSDYLADLAVAYASLSDWSIKNMVLHLIQDCADHGADDIFADALSSPSTESRAIAICALRRDFSLFPTFVIDGFVDEDRVNAAVAAWRVS